MIRRVDEVIVEGDDHVVGFAKQAGKVLLTRANVLDYMQLGTRTASRELSLQTQLMRDK